MEEYISEDHCLYKELFQGEWKAHWMDEKFTLALGLLSRGASVAELLEQGCLREDLPGVISMCTFSRHTCAMLTAETENFTKYALDRDIPLHRPNSMNRYGLVLNLIGMREILTDLQQRFFLPLSQALYPVEGSELSEHHTFTISYDCTRDKQLDMHTDDSDVTWNICLGKEGFTGSGLTFCGRIAESDHRKFSGSYKHEIGRAVIHSGQQRHGADHITGGERHNMVMWCKNNSYRNSELFEQRMRMYAKESGPPDVQCLSYTHDRDYIAFKDYPPGTNPYTLDSDSETDEENNSPSTSGESTVKPKSMPWCPPSKFGYNGMFSHNKLMLIHFEKEVEREEGKIENSKKRKLDVLTKL